MTITIGIELNTGLNPFFENVLHLFVINKNIVFITFFFIYIIQYTAGYNKIKPAPLDHDPNFKKVSSLPCGFNTMAIGYANLFLPSIFISENFLLED